MPPTSTSTPTLKELNLPDRIRIYAPLRNGDQYLRDLGIKMAGPYSSGYGMPLYGVANREDFEREYARSRGLRRIELAEAVGVI